MVTQFNCSIVATALGVIALIYVPKMPYKLVALLEAMKYVRLCLCCWMGPTSNWLERTPKPSGSGLIQFLFHNHHGHDNTTSPPAGLIK